MGNGRSNLFHGMLWNMINSIEYNQGNIEVKIDGHRHVLQCAKTLSNGDKIPESKLDGQLPLVRAACEAVFSFKARSEGVAKLDYAKGCVRWSGRLITPETPLKGLPADIKAFIKAVRTPEIISIYEALKAPEFEMEEFTVEEVVMREGKPVLVPLTKKRPKTKKVRVKNEDGTLAFSGKKTLVDKRAYS